MNPLDMLLELYKLAIVLGNATYTIFNWEIGPFPSFVGVGSYINMFDLIVLMVSWLFTVIIIRGIVGMVAV